MEKELLTKHKKSTFYQIKTQKYSEDDILIKVGEKSHKIGIKKTNTIVSKTIIKNFPIHIPNFDTDDISSSGNF